MARRKPRHPIPRRLKTRQQLLQHRLRAAHHAVRTVLRRQRYRTRQRLQHPLRRREHRRHRATLRKRPQQRTPARREAQPALQFEHPRRRRRRQLAHAVTEHRVRTNPHARPQRRQRPLQRIQRRLRPLRPVKTLRFPEHHRQQRLPTLLRERRLAAVQNLPEHRLAVIQLPAHPRPLAPLPRIQERDLAARRRIPIRPRNHRLQRLPQRAHVSKHQPRPVREVAPPHPRRPGHVRKRRLLRHKTQIPLRKLPQRPRRLPRKRQQPAPAARENLLLPRRRPPLPILLHDRVRVRPRNPERTHRRPPRALPLRPRRRLRRHPHLMPLPLNPRVGPLEVQVLRNHPVAHGEQHLDQARHPPPPPPDVPRSSSPTPAAAVAPGPGPPHTPPPPPTPPPGPRAPSPSRAPPGSPPSPVRPPPAPAPPRSPAPAPSRSEP